jgi:hypothetical protein
MTILSGILKVLLRFFNANDTSDINSTEMFFADIDFADGATSDELMQQIMGISHMSRAPVIG